MYVKVWIISFVRDLFLMRRAGGILDDAWTSKFRFTLWVHPSSVGSAPLFASRTSKKKKTDCISTVVYLRQHTSSSLWLWHQQDINPTIFDWKGQGTRTMVHGRIVLHVQHIYIEFWGPSNVKPVDHPDSRAYLFINSMPVPENVLNVYSLFPIHLNFLTGI